MSIKIGKAFANVTSATKNGIQSKTKRIGMRRSGGEIFPRRGRRTMNVIKKIKGSTVVARPVFKGGHVPVYWMATINERTLSRTFETAKEAFQFVAYSQVETREQH